MPHAEPRDEPSWTRAAAGCHLGFRKMTRSSVGAWIAKYRGKDRAGRTKSVGEFEKLPKSQRCDAAMKAASTWFEHLGKDGSSEAVTVEMACARYVRHLRDTKPSKPLTACARARRKTTDTTTVPAADDAEKRFKRYVLDQPKFASTELTKSTPTMIGDWRTRLRNQATLSGGSRGEKRTASSLNRDMTPFRAALNLAYDEQLVTSDFAWRGKLRTMKDADRQRELYIANDQRRAVIRSATPAMARFLRGLSLRPLRPGALAALTGANFDKQRGLPVVGKDKNGKERTLKLPASAIEFFSDVAVDKVPGAPLFQRPDGIAGNEDSWKGRIKEAVVGATLPANTTAYTLRHSTSGRAAETLAGLASQVASTVCLDKSEKTAYSQRLRSTQVETNKSVSHLPYGGAGKAPRETTQEGAPVQEARKELGEFLASFTSAPISVSWSGLFYCSRLRADRRAHRCRPAVRRFPKPAFSGTLPMLPMDFQPNPAPRPFPPATRVSRMADCGGLPCNLPQMNPLQRPEICRCQSSRAYKSS